MIFELYKTQARYNRWMNEKLMAVCSELSDEERKRDRGAPFKSIHGTWNHLLLTDRIWMGRFSGRPFSFQTLADELYSDWDEFQRERAHTDAAIIHFAGTLTPELLESNYRYVSATRPEPRVYPYWALVTHLFQHQAHHRGQLTTLLEQAGLDFGVTDMPFMPGVEIIG